MGNLNKNKTFNNIVGVLFILCLFSMPLWGVIADLLKPKELSILGVEMGESISAAKIVLEKRYGKENLSSGNDYIAIKDAEVDGFIFNKIEFMSRESSLVCPINMVVLSRHFKERTEGESFFNAYKLKLIEKLQSGSEPDCERDMYNGRESVSCFFMENYPDKKNAAGISLRYEHESWVVTICYYKKD